MGMFDDVVNPTSLSAALQELAQERRLIRQMQGNTAGMLLGGLAAGLGLSLYSDLGPFQEGTRFIRLARLATVSLRRQRLGRSSSPPRIPRQPGESL